MTVIESLWNRYQRQGDITTLNLDIIVNAANASLRGGGGVDGAIHKSAGPQLLQACVRLGGCEVGDAKMTDGYMLKAKKIIHTVGPMIPNPKLLSKCYQKCLDLMIQNQYKTIAFPCISTGVYGYPNEDACKVVLKTVKEWLEVNENKVLDRLM